MSSSTDQVLRVAVGTPAGPRSAVYRIWAPAMKSARSDVYIALRRLSDFKVSLHGPLAEHPPRSHLAVSKQLKDDLNIGSRFLLTWPRGAVAASQFKPEFQLVLPTSELHAEPEGDDDFTDVVWLTPAGADGAVHICIVLSGATQGPDWPGRSELGTSICSRFHLADGQHCSIVSAITERIDDVSRGRIRNAIDNLRVDSPTFKVGDPELAEPGTRAVLVGQRPSAWIEVNVGRDSNAGEQPTTYIFRKLPRHNPTFSANTLRWSQ